MLEDKMIKKIETNLFSPDEAIKRGTAFVTLYEPYKNNKCAMPIFKNDKEKALFDVQKYLLMIHDLHLYLDVHPYDKEAVELRKKYLELYNKAKEKYESMYPPFDVNCEKVNMVPFTWSTTEFPFGA